jgi:deoxyribose-phosphate aldolase
MTDSDVIEACRIGKKYRVATVIVRPTDVPLAVRELSGSGVNAGCTVGFPHGCNQPEVKALEARIALEQGAKEVDMVMNIGKFLSGDFDFVRRDIEGVVTEAKRKESIVKVILEICYLSNDQIARACEIARDAGADFVKTSTGFGDGPATPEAVDIMIKTVGDVMGVKAAGGIRTWETAVRYLNQGCKRLGIVAIEDVLKGAPE